jgi:hypothetical protein
MGAARGIAIAITAVAACVLAIISIATALYRVERVVYTNNGIPITQKVEYTAWEICVESSLGTVAANASATNADCTADFDCFSNEIRVVRAFGILTIAMSFVVFIFGLVDICEALPVDPWGKLLQTLLCTAALVFAIVCFALQVSLWSNDCAGASLQDTAGASWGLAPILMIVAGGLLLFSALFALFIPGTSYEEDQVAVAPLESADTAGGAAAATGAAAGAGAAATASTAASPQQTMPYGYAKGDDGVVVGQPVEQIDPYTGGRGYYTDPTAPAG